MDTHDARELAMSEAGVDEYTHFGKPAYRLAPRSPKGKPGRTFMTLWLDQSYAVLMLSVEDQTEVMARHPADFRPHPSKWGAQGATIAELGSLSPARFRWALDLARAHAAR